MQEQSPRLTNKLIVYVHVQVKSECMEAFQAASLEVTRYRVGKPGISRLNVRPSAALQISGSRRAECQ
jgi:hypothetical protein